MIIMELSELFMPAELGDIIASDMNLNGYRIKYQQSGETKIFTMCDREYPNPPRCLIIINNNRISIAECDRNDYSSQTEIIRITKDGFCKNGFFVENCTRSKTHTILDLIDKIVKAIDEKVMKNKTKTNVGNEITITDDDIINIITTTACIHNFTTFEVPCGNYKEIFIEDRDFPFAHVKYGFSRLDNIIQIIKRASYIKPGSVENTEILVRLDTSNGTIERLISSPIAISIAHKLEEFIKNNKEIKSEIKEEIKEEKNMPKIEVDFVEIPRFVLKDIREAVEEWIIDDIGGDLPIKNGSGDSKEYWWPNAVDKGNIDIGLLALDHGFVIVSRLAWDRTTSMNLFTITQMGNNEPDIRYVGMGPMTQSVENLKTVLKEKYAAIKIEWRKTTKKKKTKKTTKSGLEEYGLADERFSPYDIKSIKFNTTKKVTTVLFKDGTRIMTKATASDTFNPEVGLAMCIMKKLYGTRSNYKRVVATAMKNNEKSNKRIKEKADKKQKNQQAVVDHIKAQAESYME